MVQKESAPRGENEFEGRANYKYKRDRVAFVFYDFETRHVKESKTYKFTFRFFE